MLKNICNNFFSRSICLLLTVVFLSAFPSGAAALALCLDQEENHLVDQNLSLDYCHSSAGTYLPLSDEHDFALTEKENNDCVDVSLTNANTLNLPSKIALTGLARNIFSYTLPSRFVGFQQQFAANKSTAFSPPFISSSLLKTYRTVILLI